ncbi:tetratricopeptide repeat protein 39 family member [Holotrichia oblita]|uniref:Tetratricopeptide repeat protein 39 family member n=1 Tax=Holotrichia oblita TaxID=644536 RepID=A0ACB9SMR4_HOLOL|nr:tetratricopeptide repeat protein 39 family member [Holotrichia oblita]
MTTPESHSEQHEKEDTSCYSRLAREGILLLLNNKQSEAEKLFKAYPENIQMNAGFAFAVVTVSLTMYEKNSLFKDALMTFEDDKLQLAFQTLKDLEKKCSGNMSWMRSVKTRMFGTVDTTSLADQLESQIILADSYVFVATLTFLQQDISGYFKGGWILRKSYKLYQQAYNDILNLYNEIVGDENTPLQMAQQDSTSPETDISVGAIPKTVGVSSLPSDTTTAPVTSTIIDTAPLDNTESITVDNSTPVTSDIGTSGAFRIATNNSTPDTVLQNTNSPQPCTVLHDTQASTPLEGPNNPILNENQTTTPSPQNKNGYIHSSLLPSFPSHSISCYENLSSLSSHTSFKEKSVKNGFLKDDRCKTRSTGATQLRPFLKTSTSFHTALSDTFQRRPSLRNNISLSYFTSTFNIFMNKPNTKDIDKETISRLLCAVSFGYGLLQLGISLLPPSMLKLTSFLGFGGNRKNGLDNLMFARLGTDMRAPFATLALLWYHTIVRPFFALDGNNVEAGVEAAARLIDETKEEYGQSALFLFFKGRLERLNSDIPEAIKAFQTSKDNAAQREIKMMSMHEVGWCYLIQLEFEKSENTFSCLRQSSRWSRPFYSYLTIISAGSNNIFQSTNDVIEARNIFQPVPKGTQLDEFLNRRYKVCPLEMDILKQLDCLFWKILVYELLYLWNTLPSCTNENLHVIINDCEAAIQRNCEPTIGLAKLIEGSCLCILRRFNDGMEKFRECLEQRKNEPYTSTEAHVSAFAQYELGLLLVRTNETVTEGKKLLQLVAYNYKDYDFEQRLSVRVHAILKNL